MQTACIGVQAPLGWVPQTVLHCPSAVPTHLPGEAVPPFLVELHHLLPTRLQPLAVHAQRDAWRAGVRPPAKLATQHRGCGRDGGQVSTGVSCCCRMSQVGLIGESLSGTAYVSASAQHTRLVIPECPNSATHAGWS